MGKKASSKGEGCFEMPSIGYARLGWMGVANFSFQKICTQSQMFKENCRMQLSGSGAGSETELARTFHLISQNSSSRFTAEVFTLNRAATLLCV